MNIVPHLYRNIINPWMDRKEIDKAITFIERMSVSWPPAYKKEVLRVEAEDRDWSKPA